MARECRPPSSHRFGELPKLPGHGVLGRPDSGVPIAQARWGCPGRAMTRGGRLDLPSTTFSYVTLTKDSPPANGGTRWASIGGLAAEHREDGAVARAAAADADTFPKLLIHNAQNIGARPAVRHKDLGIW